MFDAIHSGSNISMYKRWRLRIQASGRTHYERTLTGYFSTSRGAEAKTRSVKNKAVDNLARDRLSGYRDSTELRSTDLICLVLCILIYLIYLNAPWPRLKV